MQAHPMDRTLPQYRPAFDKPESKSLDAIRAEYERNQGITITRIDLPLSDVFFLALKLLIAQVMLAAPFVIVWAILYL
jgi:hypothetical protein